MRIALLPPNELPEACEIINESALAYKGVIPADRWHEPYMPFDDLLKEVSSGVRFFGGYVDDRLIGVMGVQDVRDVTLIRHAYVRTASRGHGVGRALLRHLYGSTSRPVLIGAWRAATWAVEFYRRHGFRLVDDDEKTRLLQTYWSIPPRQVQESVVLVDPRWLLRSTQPADIAAPASVSTQQR